MLPSTPERCSSCVQRHALTPVRLPQRRKGLEDLNPAEKDRLTHHPNVDVDELVILGVVVLVQDAETPAVRQVLD